MKNETPRHALKISESDTEHTEILTRVVGIGIQQLFEREKPYTEHPN